MDWTYLNAIQPTNRGLQAQNLEFGYLVPKILSLKKFPDFFKAQRHIGKFQVIVLLSEALITKGKGLILGLRIGVVFNLPDLNLQHVWMVKFDAFDYYISHYPNTVLPIRETKSSLNLVLNFSSFRRMMMMLYSKK